MDAVACRSEGRRETTAVFQRAAAGPVCASIPRVITTKRRQWTPRLAGAWLAACLSACWGPANWVKLNVTALDGHACVSPANGAPPRVEVYWGGETPPEPYERLLFVEAVGGSAATTPMLLQRLRTQAANCGASAVIGVQRQYGNEEVDHLFADEASVESRNILTGLAVRYGSSPIVSATTEPAVADPPRRPAEVFGWED